MAIMEVPRPRPIGQHDLPQESGGTIKNLRELRERIDVGRHRAEIIEGRLVVSAMPVLWHEKACIWLDDQLRDFCREKGWLVDRASEIDLPPTSDLIEPDLLVLRDADDLPNLVSTRPLDHVILVAEVVSASSIKTDREIKPRACALAGVPFYLLVDRFTDPLSVTLHSEPGDQGYATITTVGVGEKLHIPYPFDITLEASALPLPR
jgi:Uma2 family endonuclease